MANGVVEGRARALPAPVFIDLTGRDRVRRVAAASAALAAVLVFVNALANGFVLDDRGIIVTNPLVTSPLTSWRAFALPYWPDTLGGGQYRPLGILSFALDWAFSGGDARWFHAVNVLWHVAATVLVWLLAAELLAPVAAADRGGDVCGASGARRGGVERRRSPRADVGGVRARRPARALAWQLGFAPLLFALGLLSKEERDRLRRRSRPRTT